MQFRNRLFFQLQFGLGAIALLILGFAWVFTISARNLAEIEAVSSSTMRKQAIVEQVNGLVYAVVMESRGLYMAENPERVELFGKGLLKQLETLRFATEEWRGLIEAAEAEDFRSAEKQIAAFTALRNDLVAAARRGGAPAARAIGDNDANRATRRALNAALETLTKRYKARLVEMGARNAALNFNYTLLTLLILGSVLVVACGTWVWSGRRIARPFTDLTQDLAAISNARLDIAVRHCGREDEVGAIAKTIETFRTRLVLENERAARELNEAETKAERARRLEAAIAAFDAAVAGRLEALSETSGALHVAASQMSAGAEQTSRQAEVVSDTSLQMNGSIETLANVGGRLVEAIANIAQGMGHATTVAENTFDLSQSMAGKFQELEQSVATIGHIVDLINQIAGQTNLLALNATIEAARAGEAGRGFAIVAQEVKQLAAQTTSATAEIAQNVSHVQAVTGDSMAAVNAIGSTIEDMRRIAREVSAAVEAQRHSSGEIAGHVHAAAAGTRAVTENMGGVARGAEETGAASLQVLQSASRLSQEASGMRGEVERFLSAIRAA